MSSGLDPVILQKLEAFSRRRRKLIILRGVFAALAMLLASMMLVALIDWMLILPDWVRWVASGLAYVAVVITEWRACLRLLFHAPDPRRLARLIEHAEPGLREDLLSAVELGNGDAALDSAQFRQMLQSDVAARLEDVNMDRLLPVQLLRRTATLALIVVAGCVLVFAASGFQFGTLLIRAMLPMANLARVSKVQVHIVEPAPADSVVAQGDSIPLLVELTGQRASKAVLETFTKGGDREVVPMVAVGSDRFSASIQVARDDLSYRVRAGDAITRKYRLQAVPRPRVVQFQKTYRYPAYARLPERTVVEENGDLVALEGSEVDLQLDTDQPVSKAELTVEQGKEITAVPLQIDGGHLHAKLPLNSSGIYRVRLTASETGFENKFSPEYELRAEPDLLPQVELELPKRDLIVPSNEVVDIRGTASDDQGLAKVTQMIRINEGTWKEILLDPPVGKEATVDRRWDLYDLGLKPGDLMATKLVAIDLKGSRAESRIVRFTITASGFESKRMTSLDAQRELLVALKALRSAGEALEKKSNEARDQFQRVPEADPLRKQSVVSLSGALDEFEPIATTAVSVLHDTLRKTTPGHSTGEFVVLGRLLGRMTSSVSQNARDILRVVGADQATPFAADLFREAADNCSRAGQRARMSEEAGRTFVTAEAIDVLNENVQVVAKEQERISALAQKAGDDREKLAQLTTRLRVVLSQTHGLEELMAAGADNGAGGATDRFKRMQKELEKQRKLVDRALESQTPSPKEIGSAVENLAKTTNDLRRTSFDLKRDFAQQPARMFQSALQDAQPTWTVFEKLRAETGTLAQNQKVPAETRLDLMKGRWESKATILKAHGDAEEARSDSDAYFVGDVRAAPDALRGMRDATLEGSKPFASTSPTAAPYASLDRAFRLLESAHNLAEIHDGLTRLSTAERWEIAALRARTATPRDWDWLEARMKASPDELGKTQLSDEAGRNAIQTAQKILQGGPNDGAWRTVSEEMKQRMRPEAAPRAVPADVERVAAIVKQALDALREPTLEARKVLTQLAPKLADRMAQLAKDAAELQKRSAEQSEKAGEDPPDQTQAEARRQLAEQRKLNEGVDALRDALRSDANKQNILEQEGRERARDADDALAMLKQPPPNAEQALAEATNAEKPADQQNALKQASSEQQKLADALNQLAQHYDALENGNPEQTRLALREAEKALGEKEALDQQYARAEQLAKDAAATPDEMLKQLERALPQNPLMRQELSGISKDVLSAASEKLGDASRREDAVAQQLQKLAAEQQAQAAAQAQAANSQAQPTPASEANKGTQSGAQAPATADAKPPFGPSPPAATANAGKQDTAPATNPGTSSPPAVAQQPPPSPSPNPQLAQAAEQQTPIAQAASQAGEDVSRAGRHEQRLQNTATGKRLEKLGNEITETAQNQVAKAQQALKSAELAAHAQTPVSAANTQLKSEAGQLAQAQSEGTQAPQEASQTQQAAANQAGQQNSPNQPGQPPQSPASQTAQQSGTPGTDGKPQSPAQPVVSPQSSAASASQQMAQSSQGAAPTSEQAQKGQTPESGQAQPSPAGMAAALTLDQAAVAAVSPQEQVWMARTLDALDGALNSSNPQQGQQQQQQAQAAGQGSKSEQPGKNAEAMARAQQAMAAGAQAASAAMRANRSQANQPPAQSSGAVAKGDQQAESKTGALAATADQAHGNLPQAQAQAGRTTDWGKLPKKVAEQLTQGQQEAVSKEYRNQVETYYRVIAERAKKP